MFTNDKAYLNPHKAYSYQDFPLYTPWRVDQ